MIQSIHRATLILDYVAQHNEEGCRIIDIATAVNLKVNTTFNIIDTLCQLNMLQQENGGKRYQLGAKTLMLGNKYIQSLSLYKIAYPLVSKLSMDFGENFYVVKEEKGKLSYVIFLESTQTVRPIRNAVDNINLHSTAIGKIFLASMKEIEFEKFLKENTPMSMFTKHTIVDEQDLVKELSVVKNTSCAFDREESELGVQCMAVPIFNADNKLEAVLGTSIPTQRSLEKLMNTLLPAMKQVAEEIMLKLGRDQTLCVPKS